MLVRIGVIECWLGLWKDLHLRKCINIVPIKSCYKLIEYLDVIYE